MHGTHNVRGRNGRQEAGHRQIVLAPAVVSDERLEAALRELEVDAEAVLELGGWRTSSDDTAMARLAYHQVKFALRELELDAEAVTDLGGWLPRMTWRGR
jgi:hypothetical protein